MTDGNQADDKIIAVMEGDALYGGWRDVSVSPPALIARLEHYFLTYEQAPGVTRARVEITHVYDRAEAYDVIRHSRADYEAHFAELKALAGRTWPHFLLTLAASSSPCSSDGKRVSLAASLSPADFCTSTYRRTSGSQYIGIETQAGTIFNKSPGV